MFKSLPSIGFLSVFGLLAGCTGPSIGVPQVTLNKGAPITLQAMLAAHEGQRVCTNYEASTNSCASIIDTVSVTGTTITSRETAALRGLTGTGTETITLQSRGTIDQGRNCVTENDIKISSTTLDSDTAAFVLGVTRDLIAQSGGMCASYFVSGDGYVASTRGRDGSIFPPGDTRFDFFSGQRSLRPQ